LPFFGGAVSGPGLGQGGGEGAPFGAFGVECGLGAFGAGGGGGRELAGGVLPGLAGSLDRGGLPFGLPTSGGNGVLAGLAGGGQVCGGAVRFGGCGVAVADGGVAVGGGLGGLVFCGFGAGPGCGELGGDVR
jgi:hypothetical protein